MKILIAIPPEKFRDEELAEPMAALQKAGIEFDIASTKRGVCTGMLGAKATAAMTFEDVEPGKYDGLVVVGGAGSQTHLWSDEILVSLAKYLAEKRKMVSAICLSPVVLARAGVLKGKNATYAQNPLSFREMKLGGAILVDQPVVVDGKVVTANGPPASKEFAEAIVKVLTTPEW
jgi:protease I